MFLLENLSFWEKKQITEEIDFTILGAGIVGTACALELRKKFPTAKIVILERSYLPLGASTKNAGFACFGSLSEIADDLSLNNSSNVWETVAMRYEGLIRLLERFSAHKIDYLQNGSWDLFQDHEQSKAAQLSNNIPLFNDEIKRITGEENCFRFSKEIAFSEGFKNIHGGFFNKLEGQIDTGKLMRASKYLLEINDIITLNGIEVKSISQSNAEVQLITNVGEIKSANVAIATNGLSKTLFPNMDVTPARAQVLVTEELKRPPLSSTFHYDAGYYYFRSIGKRILLGGGRNLDFKGETTTEFAENHLIYKALEKLLHEVILPDQQVKIDYKWSGIMGVGEVKNPIITKDKNIVFGVRMGGMGVAIGSVVGEKMAALF